MEFERVLNGILKYLNNEIYNGMNEWQEMLARVAVSRLIGDTESLKDKLIHNGYIRTFAIMDEQGNVDLDGLIRDIRAQIERKGKFSISLPMFGKFSFTTDDVNKLYRTILDG